MTLAMRMMQSWRRDSAQQAPHGQLAIPATNTAKHACICKDLARWKGSCTGTSLQAHLGTTGVGLL